MELARALNGDDVTRVFDHAEYGIVALWVTAHRAELTTFSHVEAQIAQCRALFHGDNGVGEAMRILCRHLQEMERDALGRLGADAR
jgi:hypothetical protein